MEIQDFKDESGESVPRKGQIGSLCQTSTRQKKRLSQGEGGQYCSEEPQIKKQLCEAC